MSQVEASDKSRLAQRLARPKARAEGLLKTFEWTWTTAVVFSVGLVFFLLISTSVIPSFWLYFADTQLKWNGSGPNGFWLKELRDAVAMGLVTGPIVTVLIAAAIMQNWRRKLRGEGGASRPTGGYR
jgi:ABC-type Fe3+ transport system permease subunit